MGDGTPPPGAALPEQFGPFRLLRELGAGGMGSVHLAEVLDPLEGMGVGQRVALKVLHASRGSDATRLGRFRREARLGRGVDHPALVRVLAAGASPTPGGVRHWLAMEHVEGRTLRQVLEASRTLPEPLVRHVGARVARALAAVHAAGAVHRDVKPENVMLTREHDVKVMDLGIAREDTVVDDGVTADAPGTATGLFLGSLSYASPEHLGVSPIEPASDLYSLGIVLYEAASGVRPFRGPSVAALIRTHLDAPTPRLRDIAPDVSPFLDEVVLRLLARVPSQRFASAEALALALEEGESSDFWQGREEAGVPEAPALRVPVRRDTALVGRDAEVRKLERLATEASAGEGRILLLTGEAGIGKSRLVDALLSSLQRDGGWHLLYGSFAPGGSASHRGAVAEALVTKLGAAALREELQRRLPLLPRLVPALVTYLRGDISLPGEAGVTEGSVGPAFAQVFASLAAERPTLWVVDDAHFAAADDRAVLLALARAVPRLRALLVITTRPGADAEFVANLLRIEASRRLDVPRLGAADTRSLLAEALSATSLEEDLRPRIVSRSDGNPFFLLELVRHVAQRERQGISAADAPARAASLEVPSSVRALLEGRLAALGETDRELIDVAAIEGHHFDPDLVARVTGRPRLAVLQALASMERRTGIVRGDGARFRFDHHQLQEVVHDLTAAPLRREIHLGLATAWETRGGFASLAPDDIPGRDAAFIVQHRVKGGDVRSCSGLLHSALRHLHVGLQDELMLRISAAALEQLGEGEPAVRFWVHLVRMDTLNSQGLIDLSAVEIDAMERAAAEADDPVLRLRTMPGRARLLVQRGRADEALAMYESLLAAAEPRGLLLLEGVARQGIGTLWRRQGRLEEALAQHQRCGEVARAAGEWRLAAADALNRSSCEFDLGRREEAIATLESLLVELGGRDPRLALNAHANLGTIAVAAGQLKQGRAGVLAARAGAEAQGFLIMVGAAEANLAAADLLEGRNDEALLSAGAGEEASRRQGAHRIEFDARARRAEAHLARGEMAEGLALHESTLADRRRHGFMDGVAESLVRLARLHHARGDLEAAARAAEEAVSVVGERCAPDVGTLPWAWLCRLGRLDAATIEADPRSHASIECETHLVLFQASGERRHLAAAAAVLGRIHSHLEGEDLVRARTGWPIAREIHAELARLQDPV